MKWHYNHERLVRLRNLSNVYDFLLFLRSKKEQARKTKSATQNCHKFMLHHVGKVNERAHRDEIAHSLSTQWCLRDVPMITTNQLVAVVKSWVSSYSHSQLSIENIFLFRTRIIHGWEFCFFFSSERCDLWEIHVGDWLKLRSICSNFTFLFTLWAINFTQRITQRASIMLGSWVSREKVKKKRQNCWKYFYSIFGALVCHLHRGPSCNDNYTHISALAELFLGFMMIACCTVDVHCIV